MKQGDPRVLERILHLHWQASQRVAGILQGRHKSTRLGVDVEFAENREYTPGDPLRHLDWRALGRRDRPVVKRYETETELEFAILLDLSSDLTTGSGSPYGVSPRAGSKLEHGLCLAATLAVYLEAQREPVGLWTVGGAGQAASLPPRRGRAQLHRILRALAECRPGGPAGLGPALRQLAGQVRRRSVVMVISDLMEPLDSWRPEIDSLASRKTELVVFHLLDRAELSLELGDPLRVYSPEGGEDILLDPRASQADFKRVVDSWLQEVSGAVRVRRGLYAPCWTDRPLEAVLSSVLLRGRG